MSIGLKCRAGHPVRKYKKLKPWQGRVHAMRCGLCTVDIHRDDFRWRCEEHCDYNICEDCYFNYWMNIINQAANTKNARKRAQLLEEVPDHIKDTAEYQSTLNSMPAEVAGAAMEGNGKAAKKVKDPKPSRKNGASESSSSSSSSGSLCGASCGKLQVAFWIALYIAAGITFTSFSLRLLTDKALGFPSTLLMMGLSNAISFVISQLAVCIARRRRCLGSDPDWKAANIFALMRLLQVGASTSAMCVSESYNNAFLMFYVVTLFATGVANKSEKCSPSVLLPLLIAMAGGLLAVYDKGTYSLGVWSSWADLFLYQLFSLFLGSIRLQMMQNWLQVADPQGFFPLMSPLVLATRMMPAAAIGCFELACLTYPGCFSIVLHLPNRAEIFSLLCVIGFSNAVMLISEAQLLQQTSATSLGLLLPSIGIGMRTLPMLLKRATVPFLIQIGIGLYAVGAVLYLGVKARSAWSRADTDTDYQRLEGGERDRRDRPPRSSPRREKGRGSGELQTAGGDRSDWF